jgi:hypothetical protein
LRRYCFLQDLCLKKTVHSCARPSTTAKYS